MDIFGIFDCFIKGMNSNDAGNTIAGPSRYAGGVAPKNNAVHRNSSFAFRGRSKSSATIYKRIHERRRSIPRAVSANPVGARKQPSDRNLSQSASKSIVNDRALSRTNSKTIKKKESERNVNRLPAKSRTSDRNLSHSPSRAKVSDRGPYCPAPKNVGNDRNHPRILRNKESDRNVAHSATKIRETDRSVSRYAPKTKESDRNVVRSTSKTREGNECVPRLAPKIRENDRSVARSASRIRENDRSVAQSASKTDQNLRRSTSKTREGNRCAPRLAPKSKESDRNLPRSTSKTRQGDRCAPRLAPKTRESDRNVSQTSPRSASQIRASDRSLTQLPLKSKDTNKNITRQGTNAKEREENVCQSTSQHTESPRGVSRPASKSKIQDVPVKSRSKQELSKQSIATSKPAASCVSGIPVPRDQPSTSCVGELTKQKTLALSLKSGGILSSRKLFSHMSLKRLSSYAFGKKVSSKTSETCPPKSSHVRQEPTTTKQSKRGTKSTNSAHSSSRLEGGTRSSAQRTESKEASIKPSQEYCDTVWEQEDRRDHEKTAVSVSRDITQQSAICLPKRSAGHRCEAEHQQQDTSSRESWTESSEKFTLEQEFYCFPESPTEFSEKLTLEQECMSESIEESTYCEESSMGDPKDDTICLPESLATDQTQADENPSPELSRGDSDSKHYKQDISNVPALTSECLPDQLPETDDSCNSQSLSHTSVKPCCVENKIEFHVQAVCQSGSCVVCISNIKPVPDKAVMESADPTTASDNSSGGAQNHLYAERESKEPSSNATEATLDALCSDRSQDSFRVANRGVSKPPPTDLACYPEESVLTGHGRKQSSSCSGRDEKKASLVSLKTDPEPSDNAVRTVHLVEECICDNRSQQFSDKRYFSPDKSESHAVALHREECPKGGNNAQSKPAAANPKLSTGSKSAEEPDKKEKKGANKFPAEKEEQMTELRSTKEKCKESSKEMSEKAKSSSCKEESKPRKPPDSNVAEEHLNKTVGCNPQSAKSSSGEQLTRKPKSKIPPKESKGCLDKATFDSEQAGVLPTEGGTAARYVPTSKLKHKEGSRPRSPLDSVIESEQDPTKLQSTKEQKSPSGERPPCKIAKSEIYSKEGRDAGGLICKGMPEKANASSGKEGSRPLCPPYAEVLPEDQITKTVKSIPKSVTDHNSSLGEQRPCKITKSEIYSKQGRDAGGPIWRGISEKAQSSTGEEGSRPRCPPRPEVVSEDHITKTMKYKPQLATDQKSSSGEQRPCKITKSEIYSKEGRDAGRPMWEGMSEMVQSSSGEYGSRPRFPLHPQFVSEEHITKAEKYKPQSSADQKSSSGEARTCRITKSQIYPKEGRDAADPIWKGMAEMAQSSSGVEGSRPRFPPHPEVVSEDQITKTMKYKPQLATDQKSSSEEQQLCKITKSEIYSKDGRDAVGPIWKGMFEKAQSSSGEEGSRPRFPLCPEVMSEEHISKTVKCKAQWATDQKSSSGEQRPCKITKLEIHSKDGRDAGGRICKGMPYKANSSSCEEGNRSRSLPDPEVVSEDHVTNTVKCLPQSTKDQKSSSGEQQMRKRNSDVHYKESKIYPDKAPSGSDKPPRDNAGVSRSNPVAQSQSGAESSDSFSEQAEIFPAEEGTAARCVPISNLKLKKQLKEPTPSDLRDIQEDIRIWKDLYAGCLERLRSLQRMNQAPVRKPERAPESAPHFDKPLSRTSNNAQTCLDEMQGGMDEAVRVLESEYGQVESALRKHSAVLAELVSVLQNRMAAQTEADQVEVGSMKDVKDNIHYLKALITENETLTMQLAAERAKQQVLRQVQVTNDGVDESISATEDKLHRTNSLLKMQMKRLQYEISRLTEAQTIETKAGAILVEQAEADVENDRAALESLLESNERLHELLSSKRFVSGQRVFRRASRGSFLTEETMGNSYCTLRREQLEYRVVISDLVQRNLELSNEEINYLENLGRRMYHEIAETTEEIRKSEFAWLQLRKERDELTKDLYPDLERLQMMQDVAKEKLDLESKLCKENMLFRHQLEEFQKDLLEVETELMSGVITRRTEATKNKVLELETLFENAKLHNAKLREECDSKNLTISRHDSLASLSIDEEEFQRQISEKIKRMELRIQADMDRRLLRPKRYVFEAPTKVKVSFRGQRNVIRAPKNVAEWRRKREAPQGVSEPPQPQQPKDAQELRREILAKLAEEKERAKEQLLRYEAHQIRQTADTSAEPNAQELNELLGRLGRFLNETRGQEKTPTRIAPSQSLHGGEFGETLMHLIVQLDQLQSALTGEDNRRRTVRPTITSERHRELLDKLPDASKRGSENSNPNRGSTATNNNQTNKPGNSNKDNTNSQN